MKKLSTWFVTTQKYALAHKMLSTIAVVVVFSGGYYTVHALTTTPTQTRYLLGAVSSSTIISTVSASGQIAASDTIDVHAKVTGTITWVGVTAGQHVRAGQALAEVDSTDIKQQITQAQQSLSADELQYQKDAASAPINYQKDQDALTVAQQNLTDDYNTIYNDLSQAYLDLPNVMTAAQNTLYGYDLDSTKQTWNMDYMVNLFSSQQNAGSAASFRDKAISDYNVARASYDQNTSAFKSVARTSDTTTLESTLQNTTAMTTAVAQVMQSELNFLGVVSDLAQQFNIKLPSVFTTIQSTARTNLSTANSDLTTLINDRKTLDNAKQSVKSAQQTITLDQVGNQTDGGNPISLQIEKNNLEKERTNLANLQEQLADYTVVSPFAGTVSSVAAKVSQDSSGTIASVVTNQQVATLSLNEVDAAKVKTGDKATLTFDAIDGLTLTGTVADIDPVGTVSQGVVSYTVKITLDTQDSRIKPGMTVNATIQIAVHQDVLVVPQSAVKTLNGSSYVLTFTPPISDTEIAAAGAQGIVSTSAPTQVPVVTGISDSTNIEIVSGLSPGQQIVTRTISGVVKTTATNAASRGSSIGGGNATFRAAPAGAIRIG
ncbi:MAG TPA: efflux RND transporter periplasmic adaptor subunit, partial [Candidatus Paceibacterota bacterium]